MIVSIPLLAVFILTPVAVVAVALSVGAGRDVAEPINQRSALGQSSTEDD